MQSENGLVRIECHTIFFCITIKYKHIKVHILTCLESPPYPHTLGATHCRHNIEGVSSESLREGDGGHSIQSRDGVPVGQVGIG